MNSIEKRMRANLAAILAAFSILAGGTPVPAASTPPPPRADQMAEMTESDPSGEGIVK